MLFFLKINFRFYIYIFLYFSSSAVRFIPNNLFAIESRLWNVEIILVSNRLFSRSVSFWYRFINYQLKFKKGSPLTWTLLHLWRKSHIKNKYTASVNKYFSKKNHVLLKFQFTGQFLIFNAISSYLLVSFYLVSNNTIPYLFYSQSQKKLTLVSYFRFILPKCPTNINKKCIFGTIYQEELKLS